MINICINNRSISYINWIPSETGPLINNFGSFDSGGYINDYIVEIYNSLKNTKPIFNISIDHTLVDLFEINCPKSTDPNAYIEWCLMNLYGEKLNSFDHYQYPLKDTYLNISLDKINKSRIYDLNIQPEAEIRFISVDIFSAECGARNWFKAEGNYVIWKIGNRGVGHILIIKNNTLASFFNVKLKKNNYEKTTSLVDDGSSKEFIKHINNLLVNEKDKLKIENNYGEIFFYNGGCGRSVFNNFIGINSKYFTPLNPFDVIKITTNKPNDLYEETLYAEAGIGFSGLDV